MEGPIDFVNLGVILLAALVHASLQVSLGSLLLLYHASLGKHIKKTTRALVTDYISGNFTLIALIVSALCFIIGIFCDSFLGIVYMIALSGILVALAICVWFFYYKSGRSTELWIPRTISKYINNRAKKTESNVESFGLGLLTSFAEMPFSIVPMIIAANSILQINPFSQPLAIFIYTLITIFPLVTMRLFIKSGKTVVDIQKWRVKNKEFLKFVSGLLFLTLAIYIIAFKVMGQI